MFRCALTLCHFAKALFDVRSIKLTYSNILIENATARSERLASLGGGRVLLTDKLRYIYIYRQSALKRYVIIYYSSFR